MKLVYVVSRYTTSSSDYRRHLPGAGGQPLCASGTRSFSTAEDEGDLPTCRKCLKLLKESMGGKGKHNPLRYADFHERNPQRVRPVSLPVPRPNERLMAVGRLNTLEYSPYGSSGLRGKRFSHRMGDTGGKRVLPSNAILAADKRGNLYIIKASRAKRPYFSRRGIIG